MGRRQSQNMSYHETVLDLWEKGKTGDEIAEEIHMSRDAVFKSLRMARERGDQRARRRDNQMPSIIRRHKIALLASSGLSKEMIANRLGVSIRLVQMRVKEDAQ